MSLQAGDSFGHFEILGPLGSGGMGEVYRARDPRLNRLLAIKVLSGETIREPDILRRFQHEAQIVSQLNHPAIVTVYEMALEPEPYIAMEVIEGQPLREMLRSGALPLRRAIDLAWQIADGLACAHEAGVTHRDLKPENIMVTPDNRAKILDFGLAKLRPVDLTMSSQVATFAGGATHPGSILGTVGYMSPEQARGEEADSRSDQFAFGSILYEMVTASQAFARGSAIETLSAIIRDEPESIVALNPRIPAPLRWIIERCLEKTREGRYSSTRDLAREIANLKEHFTEISSSGPSAVWAGRRRPRPRSKRLQAAALAAGVLAVGLAAGWLLRRPGNPVFRFERLTFRPGLVGAARFSPDGASVVYGGMWGDKPEAGTYLTLPNNPGISKLIQAGKSLPMAFDETGSKLLMISGIRRGGFLPTGTLSWIPTLGGQSRPLLDNVAWADWAPAGHFLVVVVDKDDHCLLETLNGDGSVRAVLEKSAGAFSNPRISPDEQSVAYIYHPSVLDEAGMVRLASLKENRVETLTPTYADINGLAWRAHPREIWFTAAEQGVKAAIRYVSETRKTGVVFEAPGALSLCDLSSDGKSAIVEELRYPISMAVRQQSGDLRDLTWFQSSIVNDISPDGHQILFSEEGDETGTNTTLWTRSIDGGEPVRLGEADYGKFSPDGRWVAALTPSSAAGNGLLLFPIGPGSLKRLASSGGTFRSVAFSGDGSFLLAGYSEKNDPEAIWRVSRDGKLERRLTPPGCSLPVPSPDGERFAANCGGAREIQIFDFHSGSGKLAWHGGNGERSRPIAWSTDGQRIFAFTFPGAVLISIPVGGGPAVELDRFLPAGSSELASVFNAASSRDARVHVWSVIRQESDLYLANLLPQDRGSKR